MKQKLILTVPFWNVNENENERSENIAFCEHSLQKYATWHNLRSTKFELEILLCNLGENVHPLYPNVKHIPHTDLKYRFEKPTRMNSLLIDLYDNSDTNYFGMCDPDLIVFENNYSDLFNSIENELDYDSMLTYSFVRTKPELRNELNHETLDTQNLENHELVIEANQYSESWEVCGGIFFMNLKAFVNLGGFNEDFRVYGFDDVDFTQRFRLNGFTVKPFPEVLFHHLWHPTVINTAPPEELDRYEYELKYWRLHREIFKVEIEKPKRNRTIPNHITPRLLSRFQTSLVSEKLKHSIQFSYEFGKHSIDKFPDAFKRQMGLIQDETFYSIETE